MRENVKIILVVVLVAVVAGGIVGIAQSFAERIAVREGKDDGKSEFAAVLPGAVKFEAITCGSKEVQVGLDAAGNRIGLAFVAESEGFGGPIKMMVAVDPQSKTVSNLIILAQSETEGLGTRITEPEFTDQFKGKPASSKFVPGEDVQAVTGATISSEAVAKGVREAVTEVLNAYGE